MQNLLFDLCNYLVYRMGRSDADQIYKIKWLKWMCKNSCTGKVARLNELRIIVRLKI